MRPTLPKRDLIEEGRNTWRIEDLDEYLDSECRRLATEVAMNSFDNFDDHGIAKFDFMDLRRFKNRFDAVHGIRPHHDFLDRICDISEGLCFTEDQQLAADLEAALWPNV